MKLREFELRPLRMRLRTPLVTASRIYRERNGFVCLLKTDANTLGAGEATPLPSFGTENLEHCQAVLTEVGRRLINSEVPASLSEVAERLESISELSTAPAARCALELALLDLCGQGQGRPIAQLMEGAARKSVHVNALLTSGAPDELAQEAVAAVKNGFRTLKMKVGVTSSENVRRLAAVRDAAGGDIALRVDANGAWSEREAKRALESLSVFRPEICEQPVAAHEIDALCRLRREVSVPIAADESVGPAGGAERLLALSETHPAVDAFVLKPMVLGGLLPALSLSRRAHQRGICSYVTSALDGPIARLGATHLAAAIPGGSFASGLAVGELFEEPELFPLAVVDGEISIPRAPGLGVRLA